MSKLKEKIDKNRASRTETTSSGGKSLLKQQIDAQRSGTTYQPNQSEVGRRVLNGQKTAASDTRKELFVTGSRNIKHQRAEYQKRAAKKQSPSPVLPASGSRNAAQARSGKSRERYDSSVRDRLTQQRAAKGGQRSTLNTNEDTYDWVGQRAVRKKADRKDSGMDGWKLLEGMAVQGATGFAESAASTLDLIERQLLNAQEVFMPTGGERVAQGGPFRALHEGIKKEQEDARAVYQPNVEKGGTAAKVADFLGTTTFEAIPQGAVATISAGAKATQAGVNVLNRAAELTPGLWRSIRTAAKGAMENPAFWSSFLQTVGSDYDESIANGASEGQALTMAVTNGLLNAGIEVGGGLETMDATKTFGVKDLVKSAVEEGNEEVAQGITQRGLQNLIYQNGNPMFSTTDENAVLNPWTAAQEWGGGAFAGGVLSGASAGTNALMRARYNQQLAELGAVYQGDPEALVEEGLSFAPETRAHRTAAQMQEKMNAGTALTDTDLGEMVAANEQTTEQQRRLERANTPPQENTQSTDTARAQADYAEALRAAREAEQERAMNRKRVRRAADSFGENGAKALRAAYDGNIRSDEYYAGFAAFYQAGINGADMATVDSDYSDSLTQAQRFAAYSAGQNDAALSLKREQQSAKYAPVAGTDSGLVYDDFVREAVESGRTMKDEHERDILDDDGNKIVYLTAETAARVNSVAKALGVRVQFVDSVRGGTANAQISGSTVQIEKNNENPVMFLIGHEMTHRMQELAPTEYRRFRDIVAQCPAEADRIQARMDSYAAEGVDLTYEQAMDEVAADRAGRMINDEAALDDFIEKHRDNRTLLQKVRDAIRALVSKLTGAEKKKAQTAQGKLTAALEAAAKQAESLETNKNAAQTDGEARFSIKRTAQMTLAQQLKMFYDGKMASSDAFYFGVTPAVLEKSGFDALPLAMTIGDFRKSTQKKHNIPRRVLKNLMGNLASPLFSFGSGDRAGIVLNDIDGDGYTMLAALERGTDMDRKPVNVINSLYGLEHPAEWIKNQIDSGNEFVLYDEKRANAFLQTYGYMASVGDGIRSTGESVTQNGAEVKTKFSLKTPVEETDKLLALHNKDENSILAAIKLGGLPMPSIAIVKARDGHTKYGPISLVFSKDTIDPQLFRANKVYGGDAWGASAKTLQSVATPEYRSIQEIKADSGRLGMDEGAEYEAKLQAIDDQIGSIITKIKQGNKAHSDNSFVESDIIGSILMETSKGKRTVDAIMRAFSKEGYKISSQTAQDIQAVYQAAAEMPTGYFEAKPQRAVGFDEVLAAVIPDDSSKKLRDGLEQAGVRMLEYKTGDDADRLAKINSVEGARFSLKSTDNKGRKLTAEQQGYFRDSVIRDDQGHLMVMYHGTRNGGFTVFDGGKDYFYFTNNRKYAYTFEGRKANGQLYPSTKADMEAGLISPQRYEVYLNVTNPFIAEQDVVEDALYWDRSLAQQLRDRGYDALMMEDMSQVIVLSPEQIKNVTNKTPTSDPDIRYSLKAGTESKSAAALQEENRLLREQVKDYIALQKRNGQLQESRDYWKGQTRRTQRVTTDKKAVTAAAKQLIQNYSADIPVDDIRGDLQSLYDYLASGYDGKDELTYTEARRRAEDIARTLVENAVTVDSDMYDAYSDLRDYLRTTKIIYGKEYHGDIADYGDFRKQQFGRLNLGSEGHTNIDQVYHELSSRWPEFFSEQEQTHPTDQLLHIVEVLDGISEINEYNPFSRYMDQAVTGAANEIMETFFDLPQTRKTFADRQALKLENAKAKGREQVQKVREQYTTRLAEQKARSEERLDRAILGERMAGGRELAKQKRLDAERMQRAREQYSARLAELRAQNRQRVQSAIARERETRARQLGALKDRYAAKDAAGRERRSAAELRRKITRHASTLSQKLLRPSDQQHIPEGMRSAVAAMLSSINQESQYTLDENGKRVKNGSGAPTKRTEAFRALREQYEAIAKGRTDFNGVLDPDLLENLGEVIAMKDTRLADMNTHQLSVVWQTVRAIEQSISTANKLLGKSRFAGVLELAENIRQSSATKRTKGNYGGKGLGAVTGWGDRLLNLDMMNPLTFLHLFGDGGDALYRELQAARDDRTRILSETVNLAQEAIGKADIEKLRRKTHTFQVEGGTLTMTTPQLMALYELSKREQAQDHIYKGGIRSTATERGMGRNKTAGENLAAALGKLEAPASGVKVTQGDMATMLSALTEEEVKIADGLQAIMQGYLAQEGNRESMKVYGYQKFTEKDYFPISSDPHQVMDKIGDVLEGGEKRPRSIAEWGSAKGTVDKANNGILLGDIFDVFAQHAVDMATYASHLGAMEDMNRVRSFTFRDGEGNRTGTMGDIIQRVAGQGGGAYLNKLLQDVSAGTAKGGVSGLAKLTANYKAASVGLNLRVALQQPTSYLRAAAVLDPKYLADPRVLKKGGWSKALKNAPIALWKDWGNFEINQGRQLQDIMFNTDSKLDRARNFSMKLAGAMDSLTWGRIWNACELEVAEKRPGLARGSAAFNEAVAQRFTDVIDQTQVVDNVLGRSQIMRSGDNLAKMATSYMGEPTQSYNLVYRAFRDWTQEQDNAKRTAAKKRLGYAVAALTASQFANAIAQALWDAVRDDDDRDEKYWERVLGHIMPNFAANANPVGMVPYLKDVVSVLQGYDVKRMDMAAITSFISACQNMSKAINGEGRYTLAGASANLLAEVGRIFGLPAATVKRDLVAIARSVGVETGDWYFQYQIEKALNSIGYSGNRGEFYDIAFGALKNGELDVYQRIASDLSSHGVKSGTIESAMRERLKKALEDDPGFSMSQQAMDFIGAREREETEKEETFGEDDLTAGQHRAFAQQRAETYRDILDGAQQSAAYAGLDSEGRNALESAAWSYAEQTALADHSGGQYTVDAKWMLNAREAREKYRIPEGTFLALRAQAAGIQSLKDKDGESIKDTKGLQIILAVYDVPGLTDKQRQALYAYLGVGKSIRNMNKAAARAKLERLRKKSGN